MFLSSIIQIGDVLQCGKSKNIFINIDPSQGIDFSEGLKGRYTQQVFEILRLVLAQTNSAGMLYMKGMCQWHFFLVTAV